MSPQAEELLHSLKKFRELKNQCAAIHQEYASKPGVQPLKSGEAASTKQEIKAGTQKLHTDQGSPLNAAGQVDVDKESSEFSCASSKKMQHEL